MIVIRLVTLFLSVITLIWLIIYVVKLGQKPKSETDKSISLRYISVLIITFAAGGIIRIIQQSTGQEWLNGFVPIFGGLYLLLMGVPLIWWNNRSKYKGLTRFLFFLLGLFIVLLGLGIIYLGITDVMHW